MNQNIKKVTRLCSTCQALPPSSPGGSWFESAASQEEAAEAALRAQQEAQQQAQTEAEQKAKAAKRASKVTGYPFSFFIYFFSFFFWTASLFFLSSSFVLFLLLRRRTVLRAWAPAPLSRVCSTSTPPRPKKQRRSGWGDRPFFPFAIPPPPPSEKEKLLHQAFFI